VVFDDLTKHAWAYRQLSLLLGRPPGREAYPGDIFYVQTQLLERAGRFSEELGNASITFLGIAETIQGDLTGYIPSNLASICDGQIYMSSAVFSEGVRPAIDLALSLSIIGGRVQPPILKALARNLRANYAQYMEVSKLSKLQAGLSPEAEKIISRGEAILSTLQQDQHRPVGLAEEVLLAAALRSDVLLALSDADRKRFAEHIGAFAAQRDPALLREIEEKKTLTAAVERGLEEVLRAYFVDASTAAAKGRGA
jgi:F-type H+/Na+-transporting ATPase subunit alpha